GASALGSSAFFSSAGAAAATAPSSMIASTCWLVTVSPSENLISFSTPSTGEGTSSTTLSVSRSTRFSSRLTGSPAFLCQLAMVASETDSGRTGTLTSVAMGRPWGVCRYGGKAVCSFVVAYSATSWLPGGLTSASATSCCCSATWSAKWPTAGAG